MEVDNVKIPLQVQLWLLEQSGYFLKAKLDDTKCESACVLFEKLLCGYTKNELKGKLQVVYSDLIRQLKTMERWDFVQAACPFVIQCCAQLLTNRTNLGMNDKLSVAATRLLQTVHWCFLEAPTECGLNPATVTLPMKTMELFVQTLVPCSHHIEKKDLHFNLSNGIRIWQPLWKHTCPDIPLFKRPVYLFEQKSNATSQQSTEQNQHCHPICYFDVAVLRCLSSLYLSEESLAWSLSYVLNILQGELLLHCDVPEEWHVTKHRRPRAKQNVSVQNSLPLSLSDINKRHNFQSPSFDVANESSFFKSEQKEALTLIYLPNEYQTWISKEGRIKHSAILDIISNLARTASLRICDTLLNILHMLMELGIVSNASEANKSDQIDVNFDLVVNCLLDLITMIGCDNDDSGIRGSKGQGLRRLAHDLFAKLRAQKTAQLCSLLEAYIKKKSAIEILNFMHSFTGFCFGGKFTVSSLLQRHAHGRPSIGDIASAHSSVQSSLSHGSTSEIKDHNEEELIKCIALPMMQRLFGEEKTCKEEYKDIVSKLMSYINTHHPKIMRKMLMNGILKSFSKSSFSSPTQSHSSCTSPHIPLVRAGTHHKLVPQQTSASQARKLGQNPEPGATFDWNLPITSEAGGVQKKSKRHILSRMKGISVDNLRESMKESNSRAVTEVISHGTIPRAGKLSRDSSSSIKPSGGSNKFRFFSKATKRSRLGSAFYSPIGTNDGSSVFTDDRTVKQNLVNLEALSEGMQQFRFITNFINPGHLPEVELIPAMLDLRAPVLSRAALLLECCHFVHHCNNVRDWNEKNQPELHSIKDAAKMFYKWGIALGSKLDKQVQKDLQANKDPNGKIMINEKSFLSEGDLASTSTDCPYGIKLLACQLLLEITAFLRDHYVAFLSTRERSMTNTSRSNANSRKASSVSPYKMNRSAGSKAPTMPAIAVQDETDFAEKLVKRKTSAYQGLATSPKYQRKLSRRTSRVHFLQSDLPFFKQLKDNSHITSSFDDDDDISIETTDFPWIKGVVSFIKSIHAKSNEEMLLVQLEKSFRNLHEAFGALYNPKKTDKTRLARRSGLFDESLITNEADDEKESNPIWDYIQFQLSRLQHAPFSVICKAALVTDKLKLLDVLPCAWQMLLHPDQHLTLSAASVVLVIAHRLGSSVTSFIEESINSEDANCRAKALLRFGILWKYRYHVWSRLEKNAHANVKILLPKMEYTLPSPLIGRDPPSTPDAPWVAGSPFPDEAIETDSGRSEGVQIEWYYDEEKRNEAKAKRRVQRLSELRKKYHLRTTPLSRDADVPAKQNIEDDPDEDSWTIIASGDGEFEERELFPASVCAVVLDIIKLLDDASLDSTGQSVSSLAFKTIWQCLVEDSDLFFRTIYEEITSENEQEQILLMLRKLCKHMPVLPPVAGTLLFNNLTGLVMYYNRTNKPGCQEKAAAILSVIWQVVPSVSNLFLKDMKQVLRKEYCDSLFMITANIPGVKDIRVSHQSQTEKFEVKETMTFAQLVSECQMRFDISDRHLVLLDKHSGTLMEKDRLIKDYFIYKRGFPTPLLKLETMDPFESFKQRQEQAFVIKLTEIAKLNLCGQIFSTVPSQKHVTFIYTELFKQSTFPRKAIEWQFDLYRERGLGKELRGVDVILRDSWIKFICTLLEHLTESIAIVEENEMFLSVLNGALLLLCEDVVILRTCLAGFINLSRHFEKIFSVNGYHCILPTILRVYSHHQDNSLVTEAIEFTVSQFLVLHQSPFILQMLASAAPILESEITSQLYQSNIMEKIPSSVFFNLIQSFDRNHEDKLDILSLVHGEKPIKTADPACKIEVELSWIDVTIRLAVTVIACRPDSLRGIQMLVVISTIAPHYFMYLQQQTELELQDKSVDTQDVYTKELKHLKMLVNYIKVVVNSSKHLCSSCTEEYNESTDTDSLLHDEMITSESSFFSWNWWSGLFGNIRSLLGLKSERRSLHGEDDRVLANADDNPISYDKRCALNRFCLQQIPRMSLLYLIADFVSNCGKRVKHLKDNLKRRVVFPEVIIERAQASTVAGVMVSMLSLALKNHEILSNIGLQRFMLQALAAIKWTGEKTIYFTQIIEKVNKLLKGILDRPDFPEFIDWDALEIYLRGINNTVCIQKDLATVPQIKNLVDWSVQLILSERFDVNFCSLGLPFATTAAKLAARLIQVNPDLFTLSIVCGDYYLLGDRCEQFLLFWFLPLCIRLGTGRYDYPQMSTVNIQFALSVILSFLTPITHSDPGSKFSMFSTFPLHWQNDAAFTNIQARKINASFVVTSDMYKTLFLGLKILIVAFEDKLGPHWRSIADVMERVLENNRDELSIWNFFHFIIEHRSPLLVHLLPVVAEKVTEDENLSCEIRSYKTRIERDLWKPGACPCKGYVLKQLLDELTDMVQKQTDSNGSNVALSTPPCRRKRAYSTHTDRSKELVELDRQWETYDQGTEDTTANSSGAPFNSDTDMEQRPLQKKRSTKRVTLMTEPTILDEPVKVASLDKDDSVNKETFHRKPVLKRQGAQEHIEEIVSVLDDVNDNQPDITDAIEQPVAKPFDTDVTDSQRGSLKIRTFERQRHVIRREKEGSSSRLGKREKWWRQKTSSKRYRHRMQNQMSFDEEEEEEHDEDECAKSHVIEPEQIGFAPNSDISYHSPQLHKQASCDHSLDVAQDEIAFEQPEFSTSPSDSSILPLIDDDSIIPQFIDDQREAVEATSALPQLKSTATGLQYSTDVWRI
eukprot:gene13748-15184_t